MCKFCEGLFEKKYKMNWNMRSSYSDDNFCEKVLNDSCENCSQCNIHYSLSGGKIEETRHAYIQCEYEFNNGDIVMKNFTEPLNINYCPYCGKKLTENMVKYEDIGDHISCIEDGNGNSWDYDNYKTCKDIVEKYGINLGSNI